MRRAEKLYRVEELIDQAGITRRTFRSYWEIGLIAPATHEEDLPLFADEALQTLLRVKRLRRDLGVNLAGIQVILDMRERILDLQSHVDELIRFIRDDLRTEMEHHLRREDKAVLPRSLVKPPKPWEE